MLKVIQRHYSKTCIYIYIRQQSQHYYTGNLQNKISKVKQWVGCVYIGPVLGTSNLGISWEAAVAQWCAIHVAVVFGDLLRFGDGLWLGLPIGKMVTNRWQTGCRGSHGMGSLCSNKPILAVVLWVFCGTERADIAMAYHGFSMVWTLQITFSQWNGWGDSRRIVMEFVLRTTRIHEKCSACVRPSTLAMPTNPKLFKRKHEWFLAYLCGR